MRSRGPDRRHGRARQKAWFRALVAIGLVLWLGVIAGPAGATALSPRIANYELRVQFDVAAHVVRGHETLVWRNTAAVAAPDLCFHLYLNAFANNRSSFMRELGGAADAWVARHPDGWGYTTIERLRIGEADLTERLQFIHPDDDNGDDRTVVRVLLARPVAPGATVTVDVDFVSKLPQVLARSGYAGPFAMVAQWFPKIGVYAGGVWTCNQYHAASEFFADFGVYEVGLTVPSAGVVGATGVQEEEHDNGDGTKTLRFRAEDVHDFAWAYDPRFLEVKQTIDGVMVRLLLQPDHLPQARRHTEAVRASLGFQRQHFGAYPYPQLTVVDPGPGARGAAGMEYPTLITVGTTWWMPAGLRLPEMLVAHETAHQYWYGIVATNEAGEPWLDEGVASFVEGRIMDATYGKGSYADLFGLHVGRIAAHRLGYLAATRHDPLVRKAWEFLNSRSYGAIAYSKGALTLETLDDLLGGNVVEPALGDYYARWRFRHPTTRDLLATLSEASGRNLDWFFSQLVEGSEVIDYAVTRVRSEVLSPFAGYPVSVAAAGEPVQAGTSDQPTYRSEVVVERLGAVHVPVSIKVAFDDGTSAVEQWDGQAEWKRFEYTGQQRVDWAVVDPDDLIPLDVNRLNNSRMRVPAARGVTRLVARWGFWFANLVYVLTGF
jgi:hypothetical protein